MIIGVPTEIKVHEKRVGLVPNSVSELVRAGHNVLIQAGAGAGISASDADYAAVGAKIVPDAATVFADADMIVKVKEPQKSEYSQLSANQILFTYLHLAADEQQAVGLMSSGCTAIAYETITDAQGGLPLLAPMSEVAGRLSVIEGAAHLSAHQGGRGVLISGVPGVDPADIVIIGGGVVGTNAAKMAVGMGAKVMIFDRSLPRLRYLDDLFGGAVTTRYSTAETLRKAICRADMVVGAVLIPGASAPKLIQRSMLADMKTGSVLVDVAIDQGGCAETSRPTTHEDPTYVIDGVVHYCVANMPGGVARTATMALNNATLPYALALADDPISSLFRDKNLQNGLNVHKGKVTYKAVADALGYQYVAADEALKA